MKRNYACPRCKANLNPNVKIILTAYRREQRGLVLLSPQPGNYKAIVSDEFPLQRGDMVEFHCPVCSALLTSRHDENLARLDFRFATGLAGKVYFSRRYGEHATYFVTEESIRSYGENAAEYNGLNFFGAGLDAW